MVEKKSVAQMIRELAAKLRGVSFRYYPGQWIVFTEREDHEENGNTMEEALTKLYEEVFKDESRIKHN